MKQEITHDWTPKNLPDMRGRTAVITGGNSGIGLEAARVFCRQRATVVLACRSQSRAETAIDDIKATVPNADVTSVALDLARQSSVKRAVRSLRERCDQVDILVNNAGIMAIPRTLTEDGFEAQFGTNHLGHFAITAGLFPLVEKARGRVVVVGSGAHKLARLNFDDLMGERGYSRMGAYATSKLATMLFGRELHRRSTAAGSEVRVVLCHPGYARTPLQSLSKTGLGVWLLTAVSAPFVSQSAERGAWPTLFAALAPEARGGVCYGPTRRLEMVGPVGVSEMAPQLLDDDVAARLWEVSEELTGARWPFSAVDDQA